MLDILKKGVLLTLSLTLAQAVDLQQQPSFKSKQAVEPMIATTCPSPGTNTPTAGPGWPYQLQYTPPGSGQSFTPVSDPDQGGCITDKLEILKQCQKLYPDKDITNIVEFNGRKVGVVCKMGKCPQPGQGLTQVYRCLESPFQSDALLVPSPCIFDHIHNSSTCYDSSRWNITAHSSCAKRNFKLKSYAVLLPCGVGLFTGVEFVCCPIEHLDLDKKEKEYDYGDDGEADDDDEDDEDYYFDEGSSTSTTTTPPPPPPTTTILPTIDPYFTQNSEQNEHANFKQAEIRLENLHRMRMSKVMRDWEELERKYQEMKGTNEKEAQVWKKTVTLRFQKTIKNLEEEGSAEKKQLLAVHQQRVLSHLSLRKKESMECFTLSLQSSEQNPNKVRKCLEKLMRILQKDRHHTLNHFRHLLKSEPKQADIEEDYTLQRLEQVGRNARMALDMLDRYPPLSSKLRPLMEDYVLSLQGKDDPVGESILTATHESEKELLAKFKREKDNDEIVATSTTMATVSTTMETTSSVSTTTEFLEEKEPEVKESEVIRDQLISVHRQVFPSHPATMTMIISAIAVCVGLLVGLVVHLKRKHPRSQGFLAVNQSLSRPPTLLKSPEEKHVANMQINGYENPTYKYFEQNT